MNRVYQEPRTVPHGAGAAARPHLAAAPEHPSYSRSHRHDLGDFDACPVGQSGAAASQLGSRAEIGGGHYHVSGEHRGCWIAAISGWHGGERSADAVTPVDDGPADTAEPRSPRLFLTIHSGAVWLAAERQHVIRHDLLPFRLVCLAGRPAPASASTTNETRP